LIHQGRGNIGGRKTFLQETFHQVLLRLVIFLAEGPAHAVQNDAFPGLLDLPGGRRLSPLHLDAGEPFNLLDLEDLTTGGERDRHAAAPRSTRASDPVQVILRVVRQIVIEYDFDIIDIDAARGDVRGHQELEVGLAKPVHDAVAQGLAHVPVQAVGGVALGVEVFDQVVDHPFGVAEDDPKTEIVNIN
jgi:hypothetical protein